MSKSTYWRACSTFALTVALAVPALAQDDQEEPGPDTHYDCKVQTESGNDGLVRVQAQDIGKARAMVLKSYALTYAGEKSRTTGVIECVISGKERFRDTGFQQFFDGVPK